MKIAGTLFILLIPISVAIAKPRNPNPATPDQIWQNDIDLNDEIRRAGLDIVVSSKCIDYPTFCVNTISHQVVIASGSATMPSLTFESSRVGFYEGGGSVVLTINGFSPMQWDAGNGVTSSTISFRPGAFLLGNAGTVSAPFYTFGSDPDTGWYSSNANGAAFSSGGTEIMELGQNGAVLFSKVTPTNDNAYTLGATGHRWTEVWAANGTIQTSHSKFKRNIVPIKYSEIPRGVIFNWKDRKGKKNDFPYMGWLADSLPIEAYERDENGKPILNGVHESAVVGILCDAVRKLQDENKILNERISKLEGNRP